MFLTLYGSLGDSGERNISRTGKDCFEKGHTDVFRILFLFCVIMFVYFSYYVLRDVRYGNYRCGSIDQD